MDLESLQELGLSKGQIAVYGALLELGHGTLNSIQEKTGIERRNIYDILNKLIEKGFVTFIMEKGVKTFQCTHPAKIREEIEKKKKTLNQLTGQLPDITAIYNESKQKVQAEVFRGNEAIKALFEDMLTYKESYWIGGNSGVQKKSLKIWFKHWMERRVEKKHLLHDLVDYGSWLEGLEPGQIKKHKANYYKYCTLPKTLKSPMVVGIFGNKVAQILWHDQPFAFVLESEEIKDSFMRYFHYFWKEPWQQTTTFKKHPKK
ncbi:hypothetical protein C4573_00620 [Candidatus Woesearchaeota archaeon]|nr:MAG: hypothetical protein C4573_00620 [Candidatus Woesearchaeota archaeon]